MLVTYENLDGRPVPNRVSVIQGPNIRTVEGRLWQSKKGGQYRSRIRECNSPTTTDSETNVRRLIAAHKSSTAFTENEISEEYVGIPLFMRFHEVLFECKDMSERRG